jgi:predicted flavoprotein YhiN
VLDLSHHVVRALHVSKAARPKLIINWTDENRDAWEERLSSPSSASHRVHSVVKRHVPARLAAALCLEANVGSALNCANLARSQKHALLEALTRFALPYSGHQGYAVVCCMRIYYVHVNAPCTEACPHVGAEVDYARDMYTFVTRHNTDSDGFDSVDNVGDEDRSCFRYKKAEVTGGGVPLTELDVKTMQSNVHSGLFLCGEICDVFGRIGGFNFYWAWVSGRAAGLGSVGVDWSTLD